MMHLRIIQRLLKKLVQLHQKNDIPQLGTNKPLLFLPYWSKINMTNFRAFVPSFFEHLSDSLKWWLITTSPFVKSSNFGYELFIIPPRDSSCGFWQKRSLQEELREAEFRSRRQKTKLKQLCVFIVLQTQLSFPALEINNSFLILDKAKSLCCMIDPFWPSMAWY